MYIQAYIFIVLFSESVYSQIIEQRGTQMITRLYNSKTQNNEYLVVLKSGLKLWFFSFEAANLYVCNNKFLVR